MILALAFYSLVMTAVCGMQHAKIRRLKEKVGELLVQLLIESVDGGEC